MSKQINDLNKSLEEQLHLNEKQEKTDNNLKTNDKTIVGAINELFQNVDSGKQLIATAIGDSSITKDSTFDAMGTAITLLHNQITSLTNELAGKVTPAGTAVAGDVLSGKTFINSTGKTVTGTMTNRGGAQTITPGTSNKTLNAGYYSGNITVAGDADLVAANIVSGKNIFGVAGTATVGKKSTASDTVIMGSQYYKDGNKIVNDRITFTILESDNKPLQVLPCFFTGSVRIKTSMWVNYIRDGSTSKLYFKLVRGTTVVKTSSTYTATYEANYGESKAVSISYDMTGIQPGDVIQMYGFTNYSSADFKGACYPMSICAIIS